MELLLKVITDTLNVVPESFYDKCSNLSFGTNISPDPGRRLLFSLIVLSIVSPGNSWYAANDTLIPSLLSIRVMYTK